MVWRSEMKRIVRDLSRIEVVAPVMEGDLIAEEIGENKVPFVAERSVAIKQYGFINI